MFSSVIGGAASIHARDDWLEAYGTLVWELRPEVVFLNTTCLTACCRSSSTRGQAEADGAPVRWPAPDLWAGVPVGIRQTAAAR